METNYRTVIITFGQPIVELNKMFDDPQTWEVSTLKERIECYESSRFTQISDSTAVITSEYNMPFVIEWLQRNTPIKEQQEESFMYKLFVGFRKLDEFPTILEAKRYARECDYTGIFTLIGDNYRDSWYKFNDNNKDNSNDERQH